MAGGRVLATLAVGIGLLAGSRLLPPGPFAQTLAFAGFGLSAVSIFLIWRWLMSGEGHRIVSPSLAEFVDADPSAIILTDLSGKIGHMNPASVRDVPAANFEALEEKIAAALSESPRRGGSTSRAVEVSTNTLGDHSGSLRAIGHPVGKDRIFWRLLDASGGTGQSRPDDDAPMEEEPGRRPGPAGLRGSGAGPPRAPITEVGRVAWDAINALPVPMMKLDTDGGILAANRLAIDLLKIDGDETPRFGELVDGLGRPLREWVQEASDGRASNRPEFLHATRAPEDTYVQVSLSCFEEDGRRTVIAILNDATELKSLEAQFVQSQKMQAIGQLAGGVAHDFNNLLTAISGHCDLLLLQRDPGDPDYADLEQINQNANRAAALVGQLLAFSRKQNLQMEYLDLRDAMGDISHLLNRLVGERITLTFTHDPEAKRILTDKRLLEQVMMNLVVNARDAMPDGGTIDIETRATRLHDEIKRDRATIPPGEYVVIRVQDEGHGIDPAKLSKIFDPFFTTKRVGEGTGLGLSTVYGIVKQTGGYVFAESTPGSGSCFTIYFPGHDPVARQEDTSVSVGREPKESSGCGVVLLVEDEAPVRAFACRALRLKGHTVLEATNGEEALECLADPTLKVDVFVSDVIMPGMDGPTWVAEALESRPGTQVIFMSGYAEESFAEGQARLPNSVLLPKPFSLSQLTEAVEAKLQ